MRMYADDNTPFDPTAAAQGDQASSDESKQAGGPSKLRQAWDMWTSRPENNAAMLQFGLAMLQPRAPGQSAIGQFANAVGQGAEASQRNVAEQERLSKQEEEMELKKREQGRKETETGYYGDYTKALAQRAAQTAVGKGLSGRIATQRAFNTWLAKPIDPLASSMGQVGDPILEALQKQFPNVKTKGDLLANPQALGAARKLFETNLAEPDEETGLPSSAAPAAPTAPSAPKPVYDQATGKLKGYYYPDRGYVPNAQ